MRFSFAYGLIEDYASMVVARKGDSYDALVARTRTFCRDVQILFILTLVLVVLALETHFGFTLWPEIWAQPFDFGLIQFLVVLLIAPTAWLISRYVFNWHFSRVLLHGMIYHDEYFEKIRRGEIVIPEFKEDSGARNRRGRHARNPVRSSEPFLK